MQNAIRSRRIYRLSGKYFCGKKDGCPPFSHKASRIAAPCLRQAQKTFEEKSKKQLTKSISHAKISKSSGERAHKNEYGRVPEWPMGTDCKSAAFSFGGSNPPAPTKKTSVENTLVFCFIRYLKFHSQGWIRTAAATSLKTAQKQPGATATTAASGRSREELLGLRPAGCACRPRHDAAAGSHDPGFFLLCAAHVIHPVRRFSTAP